jgi:hypothetical protein
LKLKVLKSQNHFGRAVLTDRVKPLLEDQLPQQFIYDLGLYLQTCAHIELSVCSLICTLERQPDGTADWHVAFHELRKMSVKDLLNRLQRSTVHLNNADGTVLRDLVEWMKKFQINRHIAAHGAFHTSDESKNLKVFYTHKTKEDGQPKYHAEEQYVTRDLVLELIQDADRTLRSIAGLDESVRNGQVALNDTSSSK